MLQNWRGIKSQCKYGVLRKKVFLHFYTGCKVRELNGSVKEQNKFHNYETAKITHKTSDAAEYIELFGSST